MAKLPEVRIIELEDDICDDTPCTLSVALLLKTILTTKS